MKTELKITKPLKETLFERIESEQVSPKSKLYYRGQEYLVWFFWFVSVVVGAFAVAISIFVVSHHQYAFYEATHNNFFTFLVDALPYLWIVVFGVMVYIAIFNMRHTSRGYRYPVWMILTSSIVVSFAGGSALQYFGLGYSVDSILGDHMNIYMSQEKFERKIWQSPEDGRLLGKQVFSTLAPTSTIIFEDLRGHRWRTEVTELHPLDVELLASGEIVRLLGKTMNDQVSIFHACGAFPWMMGRSVTLEELNEERQIFIERVSSHAKKKRGISFAEDATFASVSLPSQSVCANIAPVRKMPDTVSEQ